MRHFRKFSLIATLAAVLVTALTFSILYGQDPCLITLPPGDGSISDSWTSDCGSDHRSGSYARYYKFYLYSKAEITITLRHESGHVDTYLYLWQDETGGTPLAENDNATTGDTATSQIEEILDAGTYIIEATTYIAGETGSFVLNVSGFPDIPTPTAEPTPVAQRGTAPVLVTSNDEVCVLRNDGIVDCVSVGSGIGNIPPPEKTYVAVASADNHVCGITDDDDVICWKKPTTEPKGGKWTIFPGTGSTTAYGLIGKSIADPWVLAVDCLAGPRLELFRLNTSIINGYNTMPTTLRSEGFNLSISVDGVAETQEWMLLHPHLSLVGRVYSDSFISLLDSGLLITKLIHAEELVITIPYSIPLSITFIVAGLGDYIDSPNDLGCPESSNSGRKLEAIRSAVDASEANVVGVIE